MNTPPEDDLRPEYDFSKSERGKHHKPMMQDFFVEVHKTDGTTEIRRYRLPEIQLGNYTEERDILFEGLTLEDIVSEIKQDRETRKQ